MQVGDPCVPDVVDIIFGRWRSQILMVGTRLGVFDAIPSVGGVIATDLASEIDADPHMLYRLCRALANIGLLSETGDQRFHMTPMGACLRSDHPAQLRKMALLEEGRVHYLIWRHLEDIVRTGIPDGMKREFGAAVFDYLHQNSDYAKVFAEAMTSYSAVEAPAVARCTAGEGFSTGVLCDVGGNDGGLLIEILKHHPQANGIVLDIAEVVDSLSDGQRQAAADGRVAFVRGDMFSTVPSADAYFMKHILHDWSDEECLQILRNIHRAGGPTSRLYICEFIVPPADQPHFAKLFDIHMMVWQTGAQRTEAETSALLDEAGWKLTSRCDAEGTPMTVLEAIRM